MLALRNLDLQLLACLDALSSECCVTRAVERMGMSQPGISSALAHLRRLTNDELLVRTARAMLPTPRARELAESVQAGMRAFEDVLGDRRPFDQAGARGSFTVATADFPGMLIFPHVMQRLCEAAPGLPAAMRLPDPTHIREWLSEGGCDIAAGYFRNWPMACARASCSRSCEFELPPFSIGMVWHERSHHLGMHTWMRGVIREVVTDHVAGQLASAGSHAGIEAA